MTIKNKPNKEHNIPISFINSVIDQTQIIIKKYLNNNYQSSLKEDLSPVTNADIEIEKFIIEKIKDKFPDHSIFGEETNNIIKKSRYSWYIDPIDGTKAFISGKQTYTTLIALAYDNKPIYGIINQPNKKERWQGGYIYDTKYNQEKITTSNIIQIDKASLATTSTELFNAKDKVIFNKLVAKANYQKNSYGDAYNYAKLAQGQLDLIMESDLKAHDFMALIPVIKNAGGEITSWDGKEVTSMSNGTILASANNNLHQQALDIINS